LILELIDQKLYLMHFHKHEPRGPQRSPALLAQMFCHQVIDQKSVSKLILHNVFNLLLCEKTCPFIM